MLRSNLPLSVIYEAKHRIRHLQMSLNWLGHCFQLRQLTQVRQVNWAKNKRLACLLYATINLEDQFRIQHFLKSTQSVCTTNIRLCTVQLDFMEIFCFQMMLFRFTKLRSTHFCHWMKWPKSRCHRICTFNTTTFVSIQKQTKHLVAKLRSTVHRQSSPDSNIARSIQGIKQRRNTRCTRKNWRILLNNRLLWVKIKTNRS